MDDTKLVGWARQGDERSFEELVRRYRERVYWVVYCYLRDREDACELAQDVFVRAFRALPKFRGDCSFYTWVYRIAVNLAINRLRTRKRRGRPTCLPDVACSVIDDDIFSDIPARENPQLDMRRVRLRDAIRSAVDELPERQRAVFVLRQYEGLSNIETARKLCCSDGTTKAHYFFAVQNLQKALKQWQWEWTREAV